MKWYIDFIIYWEGGDLNEGIDCVSSVCGAGGDRTAVDNADYQHPPLDVERSILEK